MSHISECTLIVKRKDSKKAMEFLNKYDTRDIVSLNPHSKTEYECFVFDCNGTNPFLIDSTDIHWYIAENCDEDGIYTEVCLNSPIRHSRTHIKGMLSKFFDDELEYIYNNINYTFNY